MPRVAKFKRTENPTPPEWAQLAFKAATESAEMKRMARLMDVINDKHRQMTGADYDGFLYEGTYELPKRDGLKRAPMGSIRPLCPELVPEMEEVIRQRKAFEDAYKAINQILWKILNTCTTLQDVRDVLPEEIWNIIKPKGSSLTRMREPLFTIPPSDAVTREFYEKAYGQMCLLIMGKLLF